LTTCRAIRNRIKSVKNIAQVTQAMQAVSASKMRRAQSKALGSRPYVAKSQELLSCLIQHMSPEQVAAQPLFHQRPVTRVDLLLIAADRGLCGGYNHGILEAAGRFIEQQGQSAAVRIVAVGHKAREYALRRGLELAGEWSGLDHPDATDISPIAGLLIEDLQKGAADQVWVAYTEFVNALHQRPKVRLLLPVESAVPARKAHAEVPFLFEPSPRAIIGPLLRRMTEMQVYGAILEAQASEHMARMTAMRGATDNAMRLIGRLTVSYNRVRQEGITKEITDIVGGVTALRR